MSKITLDVDKQNLDTVLVILKNLKNGLIKNIDIDQKNIVNKMQEKKLVKQQAILEDEFIAKPTNSKYLSKDAFKERLKKNKG
ncbi:hypothetical protein ACH5BF_08185 [Arcobacter sp. YIC-464]|uniref:hypothetical protein n=1 Tax=Arcobacter sp. YIC-464 TaxID=3376631 RepID=UPI003C2896ED